MSGVWYGSRVIVLSKRDYVGLDRRMLVIIVIILGIFLEEGYNEFLVVY